MSGVAGVGIDLVEVVRLEKALERRPRLAERLFTEGEREYSAGRRRPGRHLAARLAAKEAVVKAMGLGPGTEIREIEVLAGSPPEIRLHEETARAAEARRVSLQVSLTHEREIAGAVVIAELREDRP